MAKFETIKFNVHCPEVITGSLIKPREGLCKAIKVARGPTTDLVQFSKGLGPCGRWVTELEYIIDLATLRIKQTSYPLDMEALRQKYMEAMEEYRRARPEFKKKREALAVQVSDEISDAMKLAKVETFIYKLEDVRGRIHAVLEAKV